MVYSLRVRANMKSENFDLFILSIFTTLQFLWSFWDFRSNTTLILIQNRYFWLPCYSKRRSSMSHDSFEMCAVNYRFVPLDCLYFKKNQSRQKVDCATFALNRNPPQSFCDHSRNFTSVNSMFH